MVGATGLEPATPGSQASLRVTPYFSLNWTPRGDSRESLLTPHLAWSEASHSSSHGAVPWLDLHAGPRGSADSDVELLYSLGRACGGAARADNGVHGWSVVGVAARRGTDSSLPPSRSWLRARYRDLDLHARRV